MKDKENVWIFALNFTSAFWILFIWFWFFIAQSLVMLVLFLREDGREHFLMVISGIGDIILSSICLGLLIIAESNRCCHCSSTNDDVYYHSYDGSLLTSQNVFGASTGTDGMDDMNDMNSTSYCDTDNHCCPSFGSRLCGGVGEIEPIVCIIVLRLLRFFLSRQFCKYYLRIGNEGGSIELDIKKSTADEISRREESQDIAISNKSGTIAELWINALTEYSDIVKKHGIFSGFLLEAMLGMSPLPEGRRSTKKLLGPGIRSSIIFERPYSQLVNCMRRCYSKYKPLLDDEWRLVDVVVTEHELVWFDISIEKTKLSKSELEEMKSIQATMKATNGGENMRLCDISMGRTILGRFSLSDIEDAKVQRPSLQQQQQQQLLNNSTSRHDKEYSAELESDHVKRHFWISEYWSSHSDDNDDDDDNDDSSTLSFKEENDFDHNIILDRLKLHSNHGTLFLKFVADSIVMDNDCGVSANQDKVQANEAMFWCKSIGTLQMRHGTGKSTQTGINTMSENEDEWEAMVEIIDEDENANKLQSQKKSFIRNILDRS